jgi:hypothetical protein
VAAVIVLLYAEPLTRVVRLTIDGDHVVLQLRGAAYNAGPPPPTGRWSLHQKKADRCTDNSLLPSRYLPDY